MHGLRLKEYRANVLMNGPVWSKKARSEEVWTEEALTEEAQSGEALSEEAMSEEARSEETWSGEARSGEARSAGARSEEARSEEARSEEARTKEARSGEAQWARSLDDHCLFACAICKGIFRDNTFTQHVRREHNMKPSAYRQQHGAIGPVRKTYIR